MPVIAPIHRERGLILQRVRIEASAERLEALSLMGEPPPEPELAGALVDTGASQTHVDLSILNRLRLPPLGKIEFYTTASTRGKPSIAYTFDAAVRLTDDSGSTMAWTLPVIGCELLHSIGCGVLLGRDILNDCRLFYDGPTGQGTLTF